METNSPLVHARQMRRRPNPWGMNRRHRVSTAYEERHTLPPCPPPLVDALADPAREAHPQGPRVVVTLAPVGGDYRWHTRLRQIMRAGELQPPREV